MGGQGWKDQVSISSKRSCMAWALYSCNTYGQEQTRQWPLSTGELSQEGQQDLTARS